MNRTSPENENTRDKDQNEIEPSATYVVTSGEAFDGTSPQRMPPHFYMSGTFVSLDFQHVQKADTQRQNFSVIPRNWYIAATITCLACNKLFLFTVDEQKVWYEEYRFYVDSFPNKCRSCRRDARHLKRLRQQYDGSIRDSLTGSDVSLKQRLVAIIDSLIASGNGTPASMLHKRETLIVQIKKLQTTQSAGDVIE